MPEVLRRPFVADYTSITVILGALFGACTGQRARLGPTSATVDAKWMPVDANGRRSRARSRQGIWAP
jgi:hypothetical protein